MNHVCALHAELLAFLKSRNHWHLKHLEDLSFILTLAYLADIFCAFNQLNYQMGGDRKNVIDAEEQMSAFYRKLQLWWQQLENSNFASFLILEEIASSSDATINGEVSDNALERFKPVFREHLQKLQRSFENYFSDQTQYRAGIRHPFDYDTTVVDKQSIHR